ncbi:hypothetical protein QQ045_026028 [Rhodiola kirilowii]
MHEFNEFQVQTGLTNAGFRGAKFTWSKNRQWDDQIWLRLDHLLINGHAMAALLDLKVDHFSRVASDHSPLLINFRASTRKPAGFKYLRAWHSHTNFLDVVKEAWTGNHHANSLLNFALKLQAL